MKYIKYGHGKWQKEGYTINIDPDVLHDAFIKYMSKAANQMSQIGLTKEETDAALQVWGEK